MLSNLPENVALLRAEEIRLAVRNSRILHAGALVSTTLSCGVALFPAHASAVDDLMQTALKAMKKAQQGGGNLVISAQAL
jgi:GGDEF domain-containing protein